MRNLKTNRSTTGKNSFSYQNKQNSELFLESFFSGLQKQLKDNKTKSYLQLLLLQFVVVVIFSSLILNSNLYSEPGIVRIEIVKATSPSNEAAIIANQVTTNITKIGAYHDGSGSAAGVTINGSYAYVADGYDGLEILDVSDPETITEIGQFDEYYFADSVAVNGSYAYLGYGADGLVILDISDPANPTEVGRSDESGFAEWVTVVGSYAYVAERDFGLIIIDISNPANPVEVGYHNDGGCVEEVTVIGSYAYVTDYNTGLEIIDISNPSNPVEVGQYYDGNGSARAVEVSGNYAYVADDSDGLEIIDISDPTTPTEVGEYNDVYAIGIEVSGNYAYIAGYGFDSIIDISDPTNLTRVGRYYESGFYSTGVTVNKSNIYHVYEEKGLGVYQVLFDSDSDGLYDTEETTLGEDGYLTDPANKDTDDDGLEDGEEVAIGTDGYLTDPTNADSDGDGLEDGEEESNNTNPNDTDSDDDGLDDQEEVTNGSDGYITDPNNPDSDSDGLTDGEEETYSTNPNNVDSDADGLADKEELNNYSTDPNDSDSDDDGLDDLEEVTSGFDYYITDPNVADSDSDGLLDGEEYANATDPTDVDSDDDGLTDGSEVKTWGSDPNEVDTDNDGYTDKEEVDGGTDPLDASSHPRPWLWPVIGSVIGLVLLILALGISFVLIPRRRRKRFHQLFSEGSKHLEEGEPQTAYNCLKQALKINPEHEGAQTTAQKVQTLLLEQEQQRKEEQQQQVTKLLEKGKKALKKKAFQKAQEHFEQALTISPEHPEAKALLQELPEKKMAAERQAIQQRRQQALKLIFKRFSKISLTEMVERLEFQEEQQLKDWLLALPANLNFYIEENSVIIPRDTLTDNTVVEEAINTLLQQFEVYEKEGKGKKN